MDNTLSGPVDVLAVLTNAACELACHENGITPRTNEGLRGHGWATAEELTTARAAVVELIEAMREYRVELRKPIGCGTYARVVARVDAALANVGGAK